MKCSFLRKLKCLFTSCEKTKCCMRNCHHIDDDPLAIYWNNKWVQSPILYTGRTRKTLTNTEKNSTKQTKVDVRVFISDNDKLLTDIISSKKLKVLNDDCSLNYDATALKIQKWVCSNIAYVTDDNQFQSYEYWQFPFETLDVKCGDCEDGAILMASLMICAGIPRFRVKVAAGTVDGGGHAWCLYLASDNEWRIMDWCYYQDSNIEVLKKPLAKKGGVDNHYKYTWFTFNNEFSWCADEIEINSIFK